MPEQLHANLRFLLSWAETNGAGAGATVLDFGCGDGELVAAGLRRGFAVVGADIFHGDGSGREGARRRGLLGNQVLEIVDGRVPLSDGSIDLIVSNQVLEHVHDLEGVLAEWARLLVPGGAAMAIFPARTAVREPHIGIPFVHWMRQGRIRTAFVRMARAAGLGQGKDDRSVRRWTNDWLEWLDRYTAYRSVAAVEASAAPHFDLVSRELDVAVHRWHRLAGTAGRIARNRPLANTARRVLHLAGLTALEFRRTS